MALVQSTWLYCFPAWLYFTQFDSTLLYHGSVILLDYSIYTIPLLNSTQFYITVPWFYFTLLDSVLVYYCYTGYFILLDTNVFYHSSTSLYILNCTLICHWYSSFYLTVHYSIIALLDSNWLYIIVTWIYFTYITVSWLYFTVLDCALHRLVP